MQVAHKLAAVRLVGVPSIRVCAAAVPPAGQPQMLQAAVSALAPLLAGRELVLDGFTMSAGLAAALPEAAAACSELSLQALTWPEHIPPITTTIPSLHIVSLERRLTKPLMSQLQCISSVNKLCVNFCGLYSALDNFLQHGQAHVHVSMGPPMHTIFVAHTGISYWHKEASMLGAEVVWEVDTLYVSLNEVSTRITLSKRLPVAT